MTHKIIVDLITELTEAYNQLGPGDRAMLRREEVGILIDCLRLLRDSKLCPPGKEGV